MSISVLEILHEAACSLGVLARIACSVAAISASTTISPRSLQTIPARRNSNAIGFIDQMPDAPAENYAVIEFASTFASTFATATVQEKVIVRDDDKHWGIVGYFVNMRVFSVRPPRKPPSRTPSQLFNNDITQLNRYLVELYKQRSGPAHVKAENGLPIATIYPPGWTVHPWSTPFAQSRGCCFPTCRRSFPPDAKSHYWPGSARQ